MNRRTRIALGVALAAMLLLTGVAAAFAVTTLTLSATKTEITYPQATWLKLRASDGEASTATTVTVQIRPVGAADWKPYRTVVASRTGEGTVTIPVAPYRLTSNTGFRAIAEGLESEVVTVSVKARLSAPVAPLRVVHGRRVTVQGFIWPAHKLGTRPVKVRVWKWESGAWVAKGHLHPKIVGRRYDRSRWAFTRWVGKADKGTWRLQVSHEDEKHAFSKSPFTYMRVR